MEDQQGDRPADMAARLEAVYEAAQSATVPPSPVGRNPKTFNYEMWTFFLIAFVVLCQFVTLAGQRQQAAEMAQLKRQVECLSTAAPVDRQQCIR